MSDSVEYPRPWIFHSDTGECDGPTFEGRFTGQIEQAETAFGPKPVARFIHEESGEEISIWLFTAVLTDQLAKLAPEKGELVRIDYMGKKKSKSNATRSYQSYKATAPERPVEVLSWGSLSVHDEEEDGDE